MLSLAIIIFRESIEISLLLSIILAVTKDINNSRVYITVGILAGVIAAALFAVFVKSISSYFNGLGDEVVDATVILITVFVIGWTVIWMQGYSKTIKTNLQNLTNEIAQNDSGHFMLVLMTATTVMREGIEIILYVYSISTTQSLAVYEYLLGLGIGCLGGVLVGIFIYAGMIKLLGKYVFKISSILLILIAGGLAADAAGILTSSGVINFLSEQLWDTSWLISDYSTTGKLLKIISGYTSRPNGLQIVFYSSAVILIAACSKYKNWQQRSPADSINLQKSSSVIQVQGKESQEVNRY